MSQSPDDEDSVSWKAPARQLSADGRITGGLPAAAAEPSRSPPVLVPEPMRDGLPTLEALSTGELVLATDKPAPQPYEAPAGYREVEAAYPPRSAGTWKWIAALVLLGIASLVFFKLRPGLARELPLPAAQKGTLMVFSEPSGATLKVGDRVVGVTPWAGDNVWNGEVRYELSLPGRQTKWGTFQGGNELQLTIKLPKK
jgi:hypothetical protein